MCGSMVDMQSVTADGCSCVKSQNSNVDKSSGFCYARLSPQIGTRENLDSRSRMFIN